MGRRTLLAILTLFAAAPTASAQTGGTVAGRVSAPDGRPLPGIQIIVSAMARGAATDSAGRFTVANVAPGAHTVQARGIGFSVGTASVTVVAGQTAAVTLTL